MLDKNKLILNGILIFSIVSLAIAYFIQYILGHKPCNLCLIERIPYIASIILIPLIFITQRYVKLIILTIFLFYFFGAIISLYHVGIEQGYFNESFVCDLTNLGNNLTTEQLLKQLKDAPVSCKDVTFSFLGLSLATINTVISIVLSAIIIKIFKNYG